MAGQKYASGGQSIALYAFEDMDGWATTGAAHTASDETRVPFGQGVEVSMSRSNNAERIFGVGARNATATINKQYGGTLTISGVLSNPYWLLGLLGANADGGDMGAYTHTYTEADILPSFTVDLGFELGTTDFQSEVIGCVINSCTISAAVNEAVRFSLECSFRYENLGTTKSSDIVDVEPVFTFAHGSIEMPDATDLAALQTFELTIVNNAEPVYGVGSRFSTGVIAKNREYNFSCTAAFNDYTDLLTYFMNGTNTATAPDAGSGTEIATMELTFTNDDGDILDINLTGVKIDEESLNQNVGEVVKEDVSGWARACTNTIYTNDVQVAPAAATNI